MAGLSDTSADVEQRLIEAYRRMSAGRKWRNLLEDFATARMLHAAGLRLRHPSVTPREIQTDWWKTTLGHALPVPVRNPAMEPQFQNFQTVVREVIRVLDRLGIAYAVGGSMASSMHGINRFTRDADLSVEPFPTRDAEFVASFPAADYYLSPPSVREANRSRTSFNILHPESGFKIDLFVRKDEPFEMSAFRRRVSIEIPADPPFGVMFHSPEDIILFKLRWYRLSDGALGQQLLDIQGVMRTKAGQLDEAYLDHWSAELGVADLLAEARTQVDGR